MKALVTGAGGFVGANLVRHLLRTGHEPVAVLRPGGNASRWRLDDLMHEVPVEFVDLCEPEAVLGLVAAVRPDVVFNLAAYGAYSWQTDLDRMLAVNVRATDALLEGARHADARLVQAGSSSEYGFSDRATTEHDRERPNSHYAVSKLAATNLCQLAASRHGQHAATLRLYSVYGPWEEPNRLMPTVVERALDDAYPPLVGPDTARDFVWVDDVCDAFVRTAAANLPDRGAVLNLASGQQTSLRSLIAIAREVFDMRTEPRWGGMPGRDWDTSVWVGDPARADELLGWRASTALRDGLSRLGAWMAEDGERRRRYRPVPAAWATA
jgi:dolichol-phosphate mannosyltransferase